MSKIEIVIDFKNKPKYFQKPLKVLSTKKLSEVDSVLQSAEDLQKQGLWVVGFLSYEAGYGLKSSRSRELKLLKKKDKFPLAWFAVFKKPEKVPQNFYKRKSYKVQKLKVGQSEKEHRNAVRKIKQEIEQGNTYQVNHTFKYKFEVAGEAKSLYQDLKQAQNAQYSAYIKAPGFTILSLSPELFFEVQKNTIKVRPMKGTINRGKSLSEDAGQAVSLHKDKKNRAENLMIVDLLRNDLGRVCNPGTVKTEKLFNIEKYPTLFQMTSEVSGQLKKGTGFKELMNNIFPSGSITGAPKIETMKIIKALEQEDRKIYTGAIGYLSPKETIFNVAIRTVLLTNSDHSVWSGEIGVGSGITYSSDQGKEYKESLLKAQFLTNIEQPFKLIETMLCARGKVILKAEHLKRLLNSARYFNYKYNEKEIRSTISSAEHLCKMTKQYKVRLLLNISGEVELTIAELGSFSSNKQACFSEKKINLENIFLYHKTTRRELYEQEHARALAKGCADVIFLNEKGEVSEGAISNVLIKKDGKLYTPPLISGLLPGTYRQMLLKKGEAKEKVLYPNDLKAAEQVYLCNSVRGMWPVDVL